MTNSTQIHFCIVGLHCPHFSFNTKVQNVHYYYSFYIPLQESIGTLASTNEYTTASGLFEQRVRELNRSLWPKASELQQDLETEQVRVSSRRPPKETNSERKSSMNSSRAQRKVPGQTEGRGLKSSHALPTASSIRKMDKFVKLLCTPERKIPKQLQQSSIRPVIKHLYELEQEIGALQQDHTHQLELERESQKTFEHMRQQITSLRKAFGILSEVLIDEVEDARATMRNHMKSVTEILDSAEFSGRLGQSQHDKHRLEEMQTLIDKKLEIVHSNMLKLETVINDTSTENKGEISQLDQMINSTSKNLKHLYESKGSEIDETRSSVSELISRFEKMQSNVQNMQKMQAADFREIETKIEETMEASQKAIQLASEASTLSTTPTLPDNVATEDDIEQLEKHIESVASTVSEFIKSGGGDGGDQVAILEACTEKIEDSQASIFSRIDQVQTELREDLEQIEQAVITGFEKLAAAVGVENPLTIFERDE